MFKVSYHKSDHAQIYAHTASCFSIVWGQENAPLVTSLPSSYYMTLNYGENATKRFLTCILTDG